MNRGEREESPRPRTSKQRQKLQTPTGHTRKPHEEQTKNEDSQHGWNPMLRISKQREAFRIHIPKLQPGPINE